MLSVSVAADFSYYAALAAQGYYHAGVEPVGSWYGVGAEFLGLSGAVAVGKSKLPARIPPEYHPNIAPTVDLGAMQFLPQDVRYLFFTSIHCLTVKVMAHFRIEVTLRVAVFENAPSGWH